MTGVQQNITEILGASWTTRHHIEKMEAQQLLIAVAFVHTIKWKKSSQISNMEIVYDDYFIAF
jgi:hypothetical protein